MGIPQAVRHRRVATTRVLLRHEAPGTAGRLVHCYFERWRSLSVASVRAAGISVATLFPAASVALPAAAATATALAASAELVAADIRRAAVGALGAVALVTIGS